MTKIEARAYLQSANEYDQLKEKFAAFASADVTERAKNNGAFINDGDYKGKGYYTMRSAFSGSSCSV